VTFDGVERKKGRPIDYHISKIVKKNFVINDIQFEDKRTPTVGRYLGYLN